MNDSRISDRQGQADAAGPVVARETIFAPATGPGAAAIAVIRVSGPDADAALAAMTRGALPDYRRASVRRLLDETGATIDQVLVLRFAAGGSYTGEPMIEIHCHGGRAVVNRVLDRLAGHPALRLAEPGEFTRRAFEAGRMDLTEVEALGDLIAAETETQRRQAVRVLEGALTARVLAWRAEIIRALSLIEVTIDWADEDVPENVSPEVAQILRDVTGDIGQELSLAAGAERLRNGFEVALVGAPNGGKSSLINALSGRHAAITSPVPGTTRDIIELRYDLDGLPVTFLDMAGLRIATGDGLEVIGIDLARARADSADLRVFVYSDDAPLGQIQAGLERPGDITVRNKIDLGGCGAGLPVSAMTGEGIPALLALVKAVLNERVRGAGSVGHRRQRVALEGATDAVRNGLGAAEPEIISEHLRQAIGSLDRLLGRSDPEAMLDLVFGQFCLGK